MRLWLTSLTGAVAVMASSVARADESAFQRLIGLASADVSANLQALRDDFALAPSEAKRLASDVAAALNDGTAVRVVTFALILVIAFSTLFLGSAGLPYGEFWRAFRRFISCVLYAECWSRVARFARFFLGVGLLDIRLA